MVKMGNIEKDAFCVLRIEVGEQIGIILLKVRRLCFSITFWVVMLFVMLKHNLQIAADFPQNSLHCQFAAVNAVGNADPGVGIACEF